MKDIHQDQYLFEQKPPTTEPGFVVFQDADEEEFYWFFHCTDMDGMPLLFSQPYLTIESARKGMQSAINNLQKKNIKMIEVEDLFHLSIFAGNYQEVARTIGFSTQEACEEHIDYLTNVGASKRPEVILTTSSKNVEKEANVNSTTKQDMEAEMLTSSSRHTFQIKYYERNGDDIYGTIAHLASGDHRLLKGLDMVEIADFIREKSGYFRELKNDLELASEKNTLESKISVSAPQTPIVTQSVRKIVLGSTNAITTNLSKEDINDKSIQQVEEVSNICAVMPKPANTQKAPARVEPTHPIKLPPISPKISTIILDDFTQALVAEAMRVNSKKHLKQELQSADIQLLADHTSGINIQMEPLNISKYLNYIENEVELATIFKEPTNPPINLQKPIAQYTPQRRVPIYEKKAEPSSDICEKQMKRIAFVAKSVRH